MTTAIQPLKLAATVWERLQDWAWREITQLRRAPVAAVLLFGIGAASGWWLATGYHAERFAVMQQRIEQLHEKVMPGAAQTSSAGYRQITEEQAAELVRRLRPFAGTKVAINLNQANNESTRFGMRLADVLRRADIGVVEVTPVISFGEPGPIPEIAFVIDRTVRAQESLAATLTEALLRNGIVKGPVGVNPADASGNPEYLIINVFPRS